MECKRISALPVTSVGERRDDETSRVSQVLVTILEHRVDHTSQHASILGDENVIMFIFEKLLVLREKKETQK